MATNKAEGRREDALVKERAKMREEYERQKEKLISETEKARPSSSRFVGQNDSMEDSLKKSTVGLVKFEDFQQRRKELEEAKAREAAKTDELKYVNCIYNLFRSGGLPDMEVRLEKNRKRQKNGRRTRKVPYHLLLMMKRTILSPAVLRLGSARRQLQGRDYARILMLIRLSYPTESAKKLNDANAKSSVKNGFGNKRN